MANNLLSPGSLARENDSSQITSLPIQAGAALVGPTVKGKVDIPKIVTTYSEYQAEFGTTFTSGSETYSFLTSISAYNYFANGGTSLLVTRVASGSFSPATSSYMETGSGGPSTGESPFILETLTDGELLNTTSTLSSDGALESGSVDNYRWEITSPNTSSGTFSLLIRRGDDLNNNKTIIEQFNNLSLDPKSPNYISRIVGDQSIQKRGSGTDIYLQTTGSYPNASRYVRVKSVSFKTPDYLDNSGNPKDQYTGSIPTAQSGTFGDASGNITLNSSGAGGAKYFNQITGTDTQGLVGANYTDAFNLLANKDEFRYNIISAPGLFYTAADHATPLNTLVANIQSRGDALIILDTELYASTITATTSTAASIDTSYAATYWPWVQIKDTDSGQLVWVPASTLIPGVMAYNDKVGETWLAPAGINRGGLTIARQAERKLSNANRDTLYVGKVNPIATLPGTGIVAYGQKTLQTKASATDRINVRRLLIELKDRISGISDTLVFQNNTIATRNQFLSQVNPYLESVQQREGLYAFKVVMDDSNNTADVIDRNELRGAIYIQPSKTAEFVYLDFNIQPTGATFPS